MLGLTKEIPQLRGRRRDLRLCLLRPVDGLVALTAVGGGIALSTGLEGDRCPPELLNRTPFTSYVVPGILLAGIVGGSAAPQGMLLSR